MASNLPTTQAPQHAQHYPAPQQGYPPPHYPAQDASLNTYLTQLQEQRVTDARERYEDAKDQLKIERDTVRDLRGQLDTAKLELATLARKHELDLRDATATAIANAAPSPPTGVAGVLHGLQGLPPQASEALMNGVMGMLGPLVQNFMGGAAGGGAGAGAAAAGSGLPAGTSPRMVQVAVAATEIFQSEDQAELAMVALQKVASSPQLFQQFLHLAGYNGEPQQPQPQV